MIFNTTYTNKEYNRESNKLLGRSFSFIDKIKMSGVGSKRLAVADKSEKLDIHPTKSQSMHFANIELRPKGIIIHFAERLERFSWCIPYYRLVIYDTALFSIHAEGNFIKFLKNKYYEENKKFLHKMIHLKNKHQEQYHELH
ncbi:hypothetical protein [Aureibacter tunicatorum]|uniref:Uncharacterized protein n=1 Tax=Aureibacter tunicatorum TaxID=866807 RepID=A0AAE4BRI3_9BACT|nr:hypothetical protein [Aureibacter tunicatorum]MDR6237835.1 hypothetical protein [Aureibacter tunicatorum]BDD02871.1 hypothetical protein AUTU_03540 [Aureibacter tunicatorum]